MLFALQMDAACLGKRRPTLAIEEGTASTCVELQIATSDIPDILGGGEGEGEVDVVVGEVPLVSPAAHVLRMSSHVLALLPSSSVVSSLHHLAICADQEEVPSCPGCPCSPIK